MENEGGEHTMIPSPTQGEYRDFSLVVSPTSSINITVLSGNTRNLAKRKSVAGVERLGDEA